MRIRIWIGLSKRQISNIFTQRSVLSEANVSLINEYNGIKEGGVVTSFYNDCAMIPDSLDATEKNLLILRSKKKYQDEPGNTSSGCS